MKEEITASIRFSGNRLSKGMSEAEKMDEMISKIRLESLVWATYINYGILLLAMIFVYDMSFLWVMILNMFTILIFFIIRFNWQILKFKKLRRETKSSLHVLQIYIPITALFPAY